MANKYIRKNTIKCTFEREKKSSVWEVHNWIQTFLKLTVDQMEIIQLDNLEDAAYIKGYSGSCIRSGSGCTVGVGYVDPVPVDPVPVNKGCMCGKQHVGHVRRPVEVIQYGNACSCMRHLPYAVEVPVSAPDPRKCDCQYTIDVPPPPVPIKTYKYGYDVEVPVDPPVTASRCSYSYSIETPPPKVPLTLHSYDYNVEVPAPKPPVCLCDYTSTVDKVLLPRRDCNTADTASPSYYSYYY